MKAIKNITEQGIKVLAATIGGNVWLKNDKIRIYVSGGNNYHYDGKWYYDIAADGSWEAKCWLEGGYNNSKRADYVAKYIARMEEEMEEALANEQQEVPIVVMASIIIYEQPTGQPVAEIQQKLEAIARSMPSSGYKMGDLNTAIYKGIRGSDDTRQYYKGRGAKYNSSVRHGGGTLVVSEKIDFKNIIIFRNHPYYILKTGKNYFKVKSFEMPNSGTLEAFTGNEMYIAPEYGDYCYSDTLAGLRRNIIAKKQQMRHEKKLKNKKYYAAYASAEAAKAVAVIGRRRFENYGLTEKEFLKSIYNHDVMAPDIASGLAGFHAQPDEGYRGCGVYRTGWRDGKMTCTVYGGFHGTCPGDIDFDTWIVCVVEEMKKHSDHIIKMDGSGTEFFFRDMEDADLVTNAVEIYPVPAPNGDGSHGYMHVNIQPASMMVVGNNLNA